MKNRDSPYVFGELDDAESSFVPRWEETPPADGEFQSQDGEDNETVIVEGRAMSLRSYRRTRSDEE